MKASSSVQAQLPSTVKSRFSVLQFITWISLKILIAENISYLCYLGIALGEYTKYRDDSIGAVSRFKCTKSGHYCTCFEATPVVHLGLSRVRTYICVPSRKRGMKVLSSPHYYDESAPILLLEASHQLPTLS